MERDLRSTPLYREIEEHFRRTLEPAFGRISGATDPAPSPDGRRIAFTGTKLDRLEGSPLSRVCVTEAGAGGFEEVTGGPNDDRLPQWSPDGTRLAFLSDRAERERYQLYLLDATRLGEAMAIPSVPGTVEYHAWSPDGAFVVLGVAGLGADKAGAEGSGTIRGPEDDLPSWIPAVDAGADEHKWRRAWVVDVAARTGRPLSREGLNVWEASWCGPDQLGAIVSDTPGEDAWYSAPLALIDVESGKERVLYRSERQLGVPAASPDGRRLAVIQAPCSDRGIIAGDVLLVDVEGGQVTPVDTRGVDVTFLEWRGAERLFFIGERRLSTVAGELDARTGDVTELWSSSESSGRWQPVARPVGSGSAFTLVLESYERPPEVAVVEGGEPRTVTSFAHPGTDHLREVGGRLEEVSWTAPDGLEIDGYLAMPPGPGPHPLLLWVHGGPVSSYRNLWGMRLGYTPLLVSRGYAVFHPNPRGSTGRGRAFVEMVFGDMGGADVGDALAGVDALVERGVADPDRIGVFGGSYGGFMTAWLVTRTDRFAAAVAVSPVTNWYSQHYTSNIGHFDRIFLADPPNRPDGEYFRRSPVMFADRVRTPVLQTAGANDRCTPPGQAVEFHQALLEHGVESELVLYPEEGHGVRTFPAEIDLVTRMVGWFERHMPARRGPETMAELAAESSGNV
jgi:dipeptidyl aminopeptidase/acylaminoacyl peptidase